MASGEGKTLYLKLEKHSLAKVKRVTLGDVGTLLCDDEAITRQLKQMKLFSFSDNEKSPKEQEKVMSALKVMQMILQEYPGLEINHIGAPEFVVSYRRTPEPGRLVEGIKITLLSVLVFFGSAFTIMAFNNDVGVNEVFEKLYMQVLNKQSDGYTELELCYSIGLALGVLLFFNHFGKKKLTLDPTPVQVEMRKYEKDLDDTCIENAQRGGDCIDVD